MRPTREEYQKRVDLMIGSYPYPYQFNSDEEAYSLLAYDLAKEIYKKYLSDPNSVESPETRSDEQSLSLIESMKSMEDWFKIVYFAKWSSYMIERMPVPDGGIYRPPIWDYILMSE